MRPARVYQVQQGQFFIGEPPSKREEIRGILRSRYMHWPNSRFGRRPLVFPLSGFSALIAIASAASQHTRTYSILWSAVSVTAGYVWFIAYALTDRSSKPAKDWTLELATFRPLWGSTNTP